MNTRIPPQELKEQIELFLCEHSHPVLTETGKDVMDLAAASYSLSVEHDRLLWHVWNEQTNVVRQITGVVKQSAGRLELCFQRFGKGAAGRLVLTDSRARPEQLDRRSRRARYSRALQRQLGQLFPQAEILELTAEPDWAHSLSGRYTRGMLRTGAHIWAVMGAGEDEDPSASENILTYALIWLDWLRRQPGSRVIRGLKLFIPAGRAERTVQRLAWMDPQRLCCEVYETGAEAQARNLQDLGNLQTYLPPAPASAPNPARPAPTGNLPAERIGRLDPHVQTHLDAQGLRQWSIRGLVFARETQRGIVFGLGRAETSLTGAALPELQDLVRRITTLRRFDSADAAHALYRIYPERWMQSVLSRELERLGFELLPEPVYEQVPSLAGAERGLMDLLAMNRQGRLAVIELKASEEIHLPLQALDYWLRVQWHQQRGEFDRQGYFPGRGLSSAPPLLLLVSPALQFHSSCETILGYFSPSIEVYRLGLNEAWREKVQVVFRAGRAAGRVFPDGDETSAWKRVRESPESK